MSLIDAVREACLPAVWSQGVKLAREGAVTFSSRSPKEMVARVRAKGSAIAPTVTLYLADAEWSCDCASKVDPCMHVAAAAIATTQADVPARAAARLVYRLDNRDHALSIERAIVHGNGREEALSGSLASAVALGKLPSDLAPTHEDLEIDRLLSGSDRRAVAPARVAVVLDLMSRGAEVWFAGERAKVSGERVYPRAVVEDAPGGFVLRMEADPSITEIIAKGVVGCEDTIRPLGDTDATGELLERLPLSRTFARAEAGELVTKILPELEKKVAVVVRTKKLPRSAESARPRIAMDLSHHGHALSILPLLVYGDPPIARVDGDTLVALSKQVPVRRREAELDLVARLRDELNLVPGRRVDFDGSDAIRFAAKLRAWSKSDGDGEGAIVFEDRALVPRVDFAGDAFDISFELEAREGDESEPKRAEAASVIAAWRDGLELVPLLGGGWAPIPASWLALHGHRVADLLAARDAEKKLPPAVLPELGALCDALDAPKPLGLERLAPLFEGFQGIPPARLPEGINASLRAYQELGVRWLAFLRDHQLGAVLADDMGLGKTLQTICVIEGRALVVCPKSVIHNWAAEIARFRPALRVATYHGPKREIDRDANVTLTTYAVLRLDADKLAAEAWDTIVLDEAQAIKNESSQTARAAFELRAAARIALSGTPVENRLEELWSVMHFANPGLLGGRSDFQERYAAPIGSGDAAAASRLRAKIKPFVLRRMKRDVLPELPPRTEAVLHVELEDSERAVYDTVRAAAKKDIVAKLAEGGGVLAALEALLRLRQAACHSALVPGQEAETSSKVDALLEALEDAAAEGHKALVFSQWTSLLDLVEPHLEKAAIRFTRLDGSTRDRATVVNEFQDEAGPPVMLVSLKAGGTGLNLTAADHVFLLDPWWNPAVEDQAADRAHRIGQDKPVMVYRLVAKDTVEERILVLKEKKRALADVALGDSAQAGGITREDLLALLA